MSNKFGVCLFFCLCLSGSAELWVKQWTEKTQYTVGETAIIHCSLLDRSDVEGYEVSWIVVFDNNMKDLSDVAAYEHASIQKNATYSKLTLTNLTPNNMDKLLCKAKFWVSNKMTQRLGNGTILQIVHSIHSVHSTASPTGESIISQPTPTPSLSWIKYLLLSVNVFFLFVGTIICITLVRNRRCKK